MEPERPNRRVLGILAALLFVPWVGGAVAVALGPGVAAAGDRPATATAGGGHVPFDYAGGEGPTMSSTASAVTAP